MSKHLIFILCLFIAMPVLRAQEKNALHTSLEAFIDILVATDGSGDFTSLQEAINAVPSNRSEQTVIFLKNGIYREKVSVPVDKRQLTLIGEDADSTIVIWDDYAGRVVNGTELNTFSSQSIRIDAPDFKAMNITFENDARPDGSGDGQNVAMSCYGDRSIFLHCRLVSWQDTYYSGSDDRQYFKDCYIEGAVDYIFGHSTVLFDSCQIHTVRSSGYITAASTLEDYKFGYVFSSCNLTAPPGISSIYLGRPWKTYARTVFFECNEYQCISPVGWHVWGGRENTCFYAEYNCKGPGSDIISRVDWSNQLSTEQALAYTRENIFSAASSPAFSSDWDPGVENDKLWALVKAHTSRFMAPENTDARIAELLVNGEALPDWDPEVYEYSVETDPEQNEMPVLEARAISPLASVEITYPPSLPGFSGIVVLANDGATHSSYRIYLSVDSSYTDSRLDSIRVAMQLIENFDPEVLEYELLLPEGTSKYFGLTGYPHVEKARIQYTKPRTFPGTAILEVSAVDGESSRTYSLHLRLATSLMEFQDPASSLHSVTSSSEQLRFSLQLSSAARLQAKIWDMNGKLLLTFDLGSFSPGKHYIELAASLEPGGYIYILEGQGLLWSGKFIQL